MSDDEGPTVRTGPCSPAHTLGPHVVGQRIVVRRVLPGETGPSGGPALTDVLGTCESWQDGVVAVRRKDGELVRIATADIVSGKPVPPRPSPRLRVSAEEVALRAAEGLRPRTVEHLGDWVLRATGGSTGRTNSVLPTGDPGLPLDQAIGRVLAFYAEHHRPAWAQVIVGSQIHTELERRGWVAARPDEADSDVLLSGVSQVRRATRERLPDRSTTVRIADHLSREWLVGNDRALANYDAVRYQLEGSVVAFASVEDTTGAQLARGRAAYSRDWLVLTDLTTAPGHRRRGLAVTLVDALLDWGGEHGATTAQLQVLSDNEPAQRLYAALGFTRHHSYRYLVAPPR